jgi:hypothetical protein
MYEIRCMTYDVHTYGVMSYDVPCMASEIKLCATYDVWHTTYNIRCTTCDIQYTVLYSVHGTAYNIFVYSVRNTNNQ